MPLDVIMPALGMAQESGVIVAWHKKPGDAVAEGDLLFEVETDKATMEVEAQGAGFLSKVTAREGEAVAVGKTIARITDTAEEEAEAEDDGPAPTADDSGDDTLPDGQGVIMPTLGMAQDSGLLVSWLVEPGARVAADDPLFEVETDKSTMEVPAGVDGYLAAQLATPGEDVPTGQVIAIVSVEPPETPVVRSAAGGAAPPTKPATGEPAASKPAAPAKQEARRPAPAAAPAPSGRILASPKARRLAMERGLDLARLVVAGHPQPFHVKDLEILKDLPADAAPAAAEAAATAAPAIRLTAEIPTEAFSDFATWARANADLADEAALLAGLAGTCLEKIPAVVAHEAFGRRRLYTVPRGALGMVAETGEGPPDLLILDLRASRIATIHAGPGEAPVLAITAAGNGLSLTLECRPDQLSTTAAVSLLSDIAGRLENPIRYLL